MIKNSIVFDKPTLLPEVVHEGTEQVIAGEIGITKQISLPATKNTIKVTGVSAIDLVCNEESIISALSFTDMVTLANTGNVKYITLINRSNYNITLKNNDTSIVNINARLYLSNDYTLLPDSTLILVWLNGWYINRNISSSTNINADDITAGTLSDARLSSNVTVQGNTFNQANKLVQTDSTGLIPESLLPTSTRTVVTEVATVADMLLQTNLKIGDITEVTSDPIALNNGCYILSSLPISELSSWIAISKTQIVTSVNGETGAVTIPIAAMIQNINELQAAVTEINKILDKVTPIIN